MMNGIDLVEDRLPVVVDDTMLDPMAVRFDVKDHVGRATISACRVAHAPKIHRSNRTNDSICRVMCVTRKHQIGPTPVQQIHQFGFDDPRVDSRSVI